MADLPSAQVRWVTAVLDAGSSLTEETAAFWSAVTGYLLSEGPTGHEPVSLSPPDGDPHLAVQPAAEGRPHPDLHVDLHAGDVTALAMRAQGLGASVGRVSPDYAACVSPGGMRFGVAGRPGSRPAAPVTWPTGRSIVDQVCLDIPPSRWEQECRFWAGLTGWDLVDREPQDEFRRLSRPDGLAVQFLLQRLDEEQPSVTGHLDLGSDDYLAEADRHRALGATTIRRTPHWVTLRDPGGRVYCVTHHPVDRPAV